MLNVQAHTPANDWGIDMTSVDFRGATLTFDGEFVTYRPNRTMQRMLGKRGFRLPIGAIRFIEYGEPRMLSTGYLRLNTGEPALNNPAQSVRDQHSFHFEGRKIVPEIEALKAELERAISASSTPEAIPTAAQNTEFASALTQLAQLRAQGILSDEEYAAKKADLLGRL